jgi:hypothetical protein
MGHLGWAAELVARVGRPAEDVWLVALGMACVGPLAAMVVPRLARVLGLAVAVGAFSLSLVATVEQQSLVALGLITVAVTAGFVSSWSARTVREAVGSVGTGPVPRHTAGNVRLTRA